MKLLPVLSLVCLVLCAACQVGGPSAADPDAPAAPPSLPYGLGAVAVEGSCQAQLDVDLLLGPMSLPLSLRADTTAAPGGTRGQVSIDVGGLVTALCLVSPETSPEGRCAVGGLVPRMVQP